MVYAEILQQARLFLFSLCVGGAMLLIYDLIRIFRRICSHTVWAMGTEDVLFWLGCAFCYFNLMYRENDGRVRGFFVVGAALGMLLYVFLLSRHVVRGGTIVVRSILRVIGKVFWFVTAPVRFFLRIFHRCFTPLWKICKKRQRILKKRLKNKKKNVTIFLHKM